MDETLTYFTSSIIVNLRRNSLVYLDNITKETFTLIVGSLKHILYLSIFVPRTTLQDPTNKLELRQRGNSYVTIYFIVSSNL